MAHHFLFILRRFGRQKLTTSLHITGLTLGITVCLLIGLFIRHEMSFDAYHSKADRIYRVNQIWADFGKKDYHYSTPFPLADDIRREIPAVERVTRVHHPFNNIIEINATKRFKQDRVMMTDPEFFDVFDVPVVKGKPKQAMNKPYQAILTQSTAKKFFGDDEAIGKTFTYNGKYNITVAAVIKDFPGNTHLPASLILSFSKDEEYLGTSPHHYGSVSGGTTFILLPEGVQPNSSLQKSLRGIYDRTVNKEPWMLERKGSYHDVELQPLRTIHFNSKYAGGGQLVKAVNSSWLWFFGSVGLAVLALACINFINLSTAQALTRAKEVGIRKTIGAGRFQLLRQFLAEALLLVLSAAVLGIFIARIALPSINQLIEKQIRFDLFYSPILIFYLTVGVLLTALLSGLYPAWLISRFRPAITLKGGSVNSGSQSSVLRKSLVIAQFTISVCLLIGLLLIGKQMEYLRNKNLGFEKDNILVVSLPEGTSLTKKELFRTELAKAAQIKDISFSTASFSGDNWGTIMSLTNGNDPNGKPVTLLMGDDRFCHLHEFKLKAGRFPQASDTNFISETFPAGQRFAKSVVNEKLIKTLGFASAQEAIGKKFWIGMNDWTADIVGVVEDFITTSLHQEIQPTLITAAPAFANKAEVKVQAHTEVPSAITTIHTAFKKVFPEGVFEFHFLDQQIDALYQSESRLYALFKIFSVLAMLISCLGLWGLVSFAAQRRVKEIGIRKVVGASVANIIALLVKDFLILVSVAIAIASPLAYWGIHKWLQDFAFRTAIDWKVFAWAGIAALLIALLTVSFQAVKAAIANPVKSLRTE